MLEYNRLNKEFIKIKDDLHKNKNKPNESEKIKKVLNYKNNEIIKIESELNDKKNIISNLENNISDLKNKNLLINKYEQEIQELNKKLNENEEYFNNEEKNRIKKDNKIKRYEREIQELKKKLNDYKNTEENIPYLETEEEAAENIADIYERRDNKARTLAPPHNVDDIENFDYKEKEFNKHGIDINGLDKDGYNINGVNKYGVKKYGLNINNTEGTRKKYSNRKTSWITDDNGILYDHYRSDRDGFNKDGYNIYGFDKNGLNKDGLNKYGYKKSSRKGLNISSLHVLLSKIYTNNSSKELINEIKKLVKNLYKNKQITKQVYNILNKALINNDS